MPELPEVETIKLGLQKMIREKKIRRVLVRLPKIISLGPATVGNKSIPSPRAVLFFKKMLANRRILRVERRAKLLRINFEGHLTLLIHLKMTGQLIFRKKGERKLVKLFNTENSKFYTLPHKYTHVIFEFTDGSKLFYNDLRQFGYLRLVNDQDLSKVRELQEYGPEPLTTQFTIMHLMVAATLRPRVTIKQFLMDPKVVAGIGNIYSDEILYWAKVRPTRKVFGIRNQELGKIHKYIKIVLKKALQAQGSSVGDFFKVDGSEGAYHRQHRVYGKAGQSCKRCGTVVLSVKLGGRTSSFCPKCQL
ncbi:MAG: bifunctional DNA-formamidopyrimidine glycosylase/DNA-(apurinic or apyrimidinic site) lyase [bacterium]|nr:bifunctional DNA-formamidopyrimidine glycosylase/DNA-(apurinic or apyrimidinic site) lyase [bacterium]